GSITRGLHTGTNDSSTSFSITSAGSERGSIGRLRTATSTPSVVKLALSIEEEMRTSMSGWLLANRYSLGASHFEVRPGGVLTTRIRSCLAPWMLATASRM